ncbi:response regulator transcription factor [Gottfriedia luciferensis]|uniref:response regulator transcription factor n=1 Tax=Gottfriedia luciferensis TaxID=178774 RepID=UPI000B44EE63|nr:response regulator transcription factor [Gottfriedia luciferensis]
MLAKLVRNHPRKNNTVIFVENSLFVSGISTILEFNQMKAIKFNIHETRYFQDIISSILITQVSSEEMEEYAKNLMLLDHSTNIIIIKNSLDFYEIDRLLHVGVKGICLTDVNEEYLINTVKQVRNGHYMIDHRFTNEMIKEYKELKNKSNQFMPPDDSYLKELLTRRELEILHLLVKGYSNIQIGTELFISNKTVKNHVANLLMKLEVQDRLNAVIKVVKNNWISIK